MLFISAIKFAFIFVKLVEYLSLDTKLSWAMANFKFFLTNIHDVKTKNFKE